MPRTHSPHRKTASALIVVGAVTSAAGLHFHLPGNLTGQGATLGTNEASKLMWVAQETVLPAAIEAPNSGGVLAFGMLMMLIGFGLHAWITMQNRDEVPVPVRAKKSVKAAWRPTGHCTRKAKAPRTSRKQMEVIWIERTIRL